MTQVARETGVGFVSLFESFLRIENLFSDGKSLYADEVHLNATGDLLYARLVYEYLEAQA
jgi:hypothetical protein